jgi:ribosomal protein S12 methylthiotransferase
LITLGCARNDVDSEELAGRLAADGWKLVDGAEHADIALINTCGFIESAKKDSVDALLEAHSLKKQGQFGAVVAVGCMAERYGSELANALPEADGILGFDHYRDISERLATIVAGGVVESHHPSDRRKLLPISPVERTIASDATRGDFSRKRLDDQPWAPLKIANGCDRRCAFCAIPSFRGAFTSRTPAEILEEARWLADRGVSELFLVSENTTSYGKDLGDLRLMEKLLPDLANINGIERIRLSYLQPAEIRPSLLQAMVVTEKVADYFDLSFQHASGDVLRRMRRFGDGEKFLHLISQIRALSPESGIRSNFIVGFPGESHEDFQQLMDFVSESRLDVIGIFPYSDEEGTEGVALSPKVAPEVIAERVQLLTSVAHDVMAQRASDRIGTRVQILMEGEREGRAEHQGPEVDGTTRLEGRNSYHAGEYVDAIVNQSDGIDLVAQAL